MAWWDNNADPENAPHDEGPRVPNVELVDDQTGEVVTDADGAEEAAETVADEGAADVADAPAEKEADAADAAAPEPERHHKPEPKKNRSGKDKKNTRKPMTGDMVSFVRTVSEAIEYKDMLPAVKALLDTNTSNVNELIAMLTEPKNREKVNAIIHRIEAIAAAGERERMMIVALGIQADPAGAKTLFAVLNALSPDRGFGRSSGDAQKDARAIDDKWGDGVDVSALKGFLY